MRLVAATNRDLDKMIENREFRSDLYYRLNVFPIRIPPLRERPEDIPLLVRYFAQKYGRRMEKQIESIPTAAMKKLASLALAGKHSRAGELHRALGDPDARLGAAGADWERSATNGKGPACSRLAGPHDRDEILRILKETKGRVAGPQGAAARMGLKRTTLISRMKKLGIDPRSVSSCCHLL